jgi:hypothetical protein
LSCRWGECDWGKFQQDFLAATDYDGPLSESSPSYDPFDGHERFGDYTELQVGPAASQEHVFPVVAESDYQWTEWFASWMSDVDTMMAPDYAVPLREIGKWLDGPDGVPKATIDSVDEFLEKISSRTPLPEEIMTVGQPWGGLHEQLTGKKLCAGCFFNVSAATPEAQQWVELLVNRTFSTTTLGLTPTSYQIDPLWTELLQASADEKGPTWLHHLHLGVGALEVGNTGAATKHFRASLELKPTALAARSLAIYANVSEAAVLFDQAWSLFKAVDGAADPSRMRLGRDLAKEYVNWLLAQGDFAGLDAFLLKVERDCGSYCTSSDVVQFGQAKAALFGSQHSPGAAIEILKANCWPTFSNRRGDLNQLWLDANVAIELAKQNVAALSRMDMIRLRRTLGCDGDGTMAGSCIVGPPNIGYPY